MILSLSSLRADTTMMGIWNGGAPATQLQYLDDIVITTDQPSNTDAFGNRMIGPTGWSSARRLSLAGSLIKIVEPGP